MLQKLYLKNFILIDEITLHFHQSLNVFVGETGAGKSLIVDALQIIAGKRASSYMIKNNNEKAIIEAVFEVENENVLKKLSSLDVEYEDYLIITKEITKDKTITKLNNRTITNSFLKQITPLLFDIYEQHALHEFLNPQTHLQLLDRFGNIDLTNYTKQYNILLKLKEKKESLLNDEQFDIEFLKYQLSEINKVNPQQNEEESLLQIQNDFLKTQKSKKALESALERIEISGLHQLGKILEDEKLIDIYYYLEELIIEQHKKLKENDDFDIDQVQSRLFQLQNLKRKYGNDINKVINKKQLLSQQIDEFENQELILEKLDKEIIKQEKYCNTLAKEISDLRKNAAKNLEKQFINQLIDLNFSFIEFEIEINETLLSKTGNNTVDFLASFNKGNKKQKIHESASGGELSRVLLALKSIFSKYQNIETMIFDEIDTGVSGKAALSISKKLYKIARQKQVLCITHLATVAASGDQVFQVNKNFDEQTNTTIQILNDDQLIQQIALMASSNTSIPSLENAKSLLTYVKKEISNE